MNRALETDSLLKLFHQQFSKIPDVRSKNRQICLSDFLMSAMGIFMLKEPSLLSFQKSLNETEENLKDVFCIESIPSDTHLRETVDKISPHHFSACFIELLKRVTKAGMLNPFYYMDSLLVSCDGTGYYSSEKISCKSCMEKHRKNGTVEYYHQYFGAAIVHPDMKTVLPLMPEPIQKHDGSSKNDCERNASKRLLKSLSVDYPGFKITIIEDSLASNGPHLKEIKKYGYSYIIGAKPGDHKFLFGQADALRQTGSIQKMEIDQDGILHRFEYANGLLLNKTTAGLTVNFIEYWEINRETGKTQHFSWVTDKRIDRDNIYAIMRGGRARWKIENETFNTLKSQGYNFEHNYGHGNENLCFNFAVMMTLAFAIDQIQELASPIFKKALKKAGRRTGLWEKIRGLFFTFRVSSFDSMYKSLAFGFKKTKLSENTS